MDRTELEDRIRTSLEARAQDVAPTPHLWEKVTDRRARHTRWMVGLWALAGSAAVAVVAIAAVQVMRAPEGPPVIDNPPATEEPTPTEEPTDTDPAPGGATGPVSVVTTDGDALYEVDASTGEVVNELPVFERLTEGGPIGSVAVRPGDGSELTVATMIGIEGTSWELEVTTFGPDRQSEARHRATPLNDQGNPASAGGAFTTDTQAFPPTVIWSPDGQHLAWVRNHPDGTDDVMTITWDALLAGEEPWVIVANLPDVGTPRIQDWTGTGTLWLTNTGGGEALLDVPEECLEDAACPDFQQLQPRGLGMEGGSIIDIAHDANGTTMALVGRGSQSQDAEGSTVELLAAPMSDNQHVLELPPSSVLDGAAVPPDGWLVAAGDRAVLGYGSSAQLLTLTGEFEEDLAVADIVDLPEGTRAAGLALTGGGGGTAEPTPEVTEATATVGQDGVPEHVVVHDPAADEFRLVHRGQPDQSLATWGLPDGVDGETSLAEVVVHPASTPDDLQLVTRWVIGESDVFARTVVRDEQVLANAAFDAEGQPRNIGGAAEIADSSPVFSPTGEWLAWVETPEGAQGPAQVRIVAWSDNGPTGPTTILEVPQGEARPMALLDWASRPPGTDILTMRWVSGPEGQSGAGFVELTMDGFDGSTPAEDDLDWRWVGLPGALVDAGSFLFEDGSERYVAFSDGEGTVRYGLAEAPETAVETSVRAFGEGRLLAFGPDSAVIQRPDGGWERVQVDTGAASAVRVPDGTVALLPWAPVAGG